MKTIIGIFIVLHGLVHLLYLGQSLRYFELRPGMIWPDSSWLMSKYFSSESMRLLAGSLCVTAAAGFIISGTGLLLSQDWWRALLVVSAILSVLIFILYWDGQWHKLDDQGGYGILINITIMFMAFLSVNC